MDIVYTPESLNHVTIHHPESVDRLISFDNIPTDTLTPDESSLRLVHTQQYIEDVKKKCLHSEMLDPDTQTSPGSFSAALFAVAATIQASETDNFALVRPPGHHAYPDHGAGFCIFNNIAIASQKLIAEGKRVCIVDIDGHLGDGTESFFYSSNSVLYISLHQEHAYPEKGLPEEIGEGNGKGFTINMPIPKKCGDDAYLQILHRLLPIAIEFKPDIIAVSAGFDTYRTDPVLELNLSKNAYHQIGALLHKSFPHIFAVLEGGYDTKALPECVYNFIDGVNGTKIRFSENSTETPFLSLEQIQFQLDSLIDLLKPYWKSAV